MNAFGSFSLSDKGAGLVNILIVLPEANEECVAKITYSFFIVLSKKVSM